MPANGVDERQSSAALSGADYDRMWRALGDFIRFNPGARHRRRMALSMLRGQSFDRCLDVGCGKGDLLLALRKRGVPAERLWGADLSAEVIVNDRQALPGVTLQVLDIQTATLPSSTAFFDLILCAEVIEHLADRPVAFAHLVAMLKPGGRLLVTCPTGRVFETERQFGHVSHPSVEELRDLAAANGLRVERIVNWGWPLYRAGKVVTNLNPAWAMRSFAAGRYSVPKCLLLAALYYLSFLSFDSPWGCQLFALFVKPGAAAGPAGDGPRKNEGTAAASTARNSTV
jgi:SAM-dependent methyltransferase